MMYRDLWTEKAIEHATETYFDKTMNKSIQLSIEELDRLTKQLKDLVFLSKDEKIVYFTHIEEGVLNIERPFTRIGKGVYDDGDWIITSHKLLYGEHPITKAKKGLLRSDKTVHHDRYNKPISVKVDVHTIEKVYFNKAKELVVDYDSCYLLLWAASDNLKNNIKVELDKTISAHKYAARALLK